MTINVFAQTQSLPTCTDPTSQNLPCIMVISTLPAPVNAVQCQETTGQILSCSYATQTLNNGQQIVVITVYVPANFVFSPGVVKVVVHETEKTVINNIIRVVCPPFVFCPQLHTGDFLAGYHLGSQDGSVGIYDPVPACTGKTGAALEHCYTGYKDAYVTACHKSQFGCGDGPITCPPGESTIDCHVPIVGLPPGLPPCNGPHYSHLLVNCPVITSEGGKGTGTTCAAGNCTSGLTLPTKIDCTKNPSDPSCQQQQQQHHTAAYLQALNSGSPNPYKPGTIDYQHYQAGLLARQQNVGGAPGIMTPGGTNSNNNSIPSATKKCPDGSTIPVKDKCTALKQTNPSITSTGSSTSSSPSDSLPPPSGGSSSGGGSGSGGGSSDSSSSSSSGSSSSGSSSGSSSNSDSGLHHRH